MSNLPPDPWKALGVDKTADKSEIRTAYRKLVLKCHPDKVQDATLKAQKQEEFQKVQQAYELLNNDSELSKYEEQLRKTQQASMKTAANMSIPRTPKPARYEYDIRTAEPPVTRYKSSYSSPSAGKYNSASPHTRSHEEVPSSRAYPYDDADKHPRRATSYEKPPKRDDEKREKEERRRQRREEEELARFKEKERELAREKEREREREREREARRAEKKKIERLDKERDKERRRDTEDKSRRHNKPYVEPYAEYASFEMDEPYVADEMYVSSSRSDKKTRSSSKKFDEPRERERERDRERDRDREREQRDKSTSRREKSPHVLMPVPPEQKHLEHYQHAASYISRAGGSVPKETPAFWKSQTPPDSYMIPVAPTPPPADLEEESIQRSAKRAATRRPSHEASRSKEKLKYDIDPSPKARPIPGMTKSYSMPVPPPDSPPRVIRTNTIPGEAVYERTIPILSRTHTWTAGGVVADRRAADYDDYYGSDEDRRHRRNRRARSPVMETTHHYKVDGTKSSKLDKHVYSGSPTSARKYAYDPLDTHTPTTYSGFKVKEAKSYGLNDVKYAEYTTAEATPAYYPSHGDSYPVAA